MANLKVKLLKKANKEQQRYIKFLEDSLVKYEKALARPAIAVFQDNQVKELARLIAGILFPGEGKVH